MKVLGEKRSGNDGLESTSQKRSASNEDLEPPAEFFGGENTNPNTAKSSSNNTIVEGSERRKKWRHIEAVCLF